MAASTSLSGVRCGCPFCGSRSGPGGPWLLPVGHEWDITPLLTPGTNAVAVEVAGYNVNSYYLLDQPSFLQAEAVSDGAVLAATDSGTSRTVFVRRGNSPPGSQERVQKTQRYSFQRPFSEVWRLAPGWAGSGGRGRGCRRRACHLPRRQGNPAPREHVPLPDFGLRPPVANVGFGSLRRGAMPERPLEGSRAHRHRTAVGWLSGERTHGCAVS